MNNTSILTDIELDAVAGGSIFSEITAAAAGGAGKGTGLPPPHFGVGPATGTGGGSHLCSNHNGLIYPK
jgi:hypothetical protein